MESRSDKGYRGDAAQFFVAGELCRRGLVAVVTLGNCPNTDILVSNAAGTGFCHVQVKTFLPGTRTVSVGMQAERDHGTHFFWVLAGILTPDSAREFEYYVVPAADMAREVMAGFQHWATIPGAKGQIRAADNKIRTLQLPPRTESNGWSLFSYLNNWQIIVDRLAS